MPNIRMLIFINGQLHFGCTIRNEIDQCSLQPQNVILLAPQHSSISLIDPHNNKFSTNLSSTAGTDTSRYTLMWVLIYMARNPECQKMLQDEINEIVGQYVFTCRS